MTKQNNRSEYFNGLSVWALSFGGIIGWGCFIMPGSKFLNDAGPVGSIIGIVLATIFALIISSNYSSMIKKHPEIGGSYTYTRKILGEDHAFLTAWCLILAYMSLIWANATAISVMVRYAAGDVLHWGFHYNISGNNIYLGEIITTAAAILTLGLLTAYNHTLANILRTISSLALFISIVIIFFIIVRKNGLSVSLEPAFADGKNHFMQVLSVFVLAPWMYVGFETATHVIGESKFSTSRIFLYVGLAIISGMLIYIMVTLIAATSPEGYTN